MSPTPPCLPLTQTLVFRDVAAVEEVGLEFRLIYYGPLPPAASKDSRAREKQAIRQFLHPQLKQWWTHNERWMGNADRISHNFDEFGFRFAPVLRSDMSTYCSIDVLFLRRDAPGKILDSGGGGDIDNRLKVLFDGLRKPRQREELCGATPGEGDQPFFCLLEDDSMVTEVRVVTDRLLLPVKTVDRHEVHNVELIIHVRSDQDAARSSDVDRALSMASTPRARYPWESR